MTTTYSKEPLSVKSQIELLKSRELIIDNEAVTEAVLYSESYFRLIAYFRPMEINKDKHEFKPNSRFDDAVALYRFDCELRNIIFKAVQDIEIALRTRIIQEFSMRNGAFWFYETALAVDGHQFLENMTSLDRELKRSKEDFIREHYAKYDNPAFPPSWKSLELASFGTLSKFYYNFSDIRAKKIVARSFNLPQHEVLESWMRSIAVLRNCCAHHARIWNRVYPKMPQLTGFRPRGQCITNIPMSMSQPWVFLKIGKQNHCGVKHRLIHKNRVGVTGVCCSCLSGGSCRSRPCFFCAKSGIAAGLQLLL